MSEKQPDLTIPEFATEALDLVAPLFKLFERARREVDGRYEDLDDANTEVWRLRDELRGYKWKTCLDAEPDPKTFKVRADLDAAGERVAAVRLAIRDAKTAVDAYGGALAHAGLAYIVRVLVANPDRVVGMRPFDKEFEQLIDSLVDDVRDAAGHSFGFFVNTHAELFLYAGGNRFRANVDFGSDGCKRIAPQDLRSAEEGLSVYRVEDVEAALDVARAAHRRIDAMKAAYTEYVEAHNAELDAILGDLSALPGNYDIVARAQSCKR